MKLLDVEVIVKVTCQLCGYEDYCDDLLSRVLSRKEEYERCILSYGCKGWMSAQYLKDEEWI